MDAVTLALAKKHTNEQVIQKATNSPTETISFDNGIYSVGNNVVNGQVSASLKGMTYTNLLGDGGDFEDNNILTSGVNNFAFVYSTDRVFGAKSIRLTPVGGHNTRSAGVNLVQGRYYLLSVYHKNEAENGEETYLAYRDATPVGIYPSTNIIMLSRTTLTFRRQGVKFQAISSDGYVGVSRGGAGALANIFLDGMMLNEITADDYNNLTVDQLMQKYPYINNTKSTNSVRVKSVGKNLFDESRKPDEVPSEGIGFECKDILEVGKTYTLSGVGEVYSKISEAQTAGGQLLNYGKLDIRTFTWTQKANDDNYKLYLWTFDISDMNVQLEEGTTATEYEPYKESSAIINLPEPLRSLPNGVKDEFNATTGIKTQRVGVKENVASGTVINYTDMATAGQFAAWGSGEHVVGVKGDTLAFTATSLIYQLATPIVTKLPAQAPLQVFENGTVYVEPIGDPAESTLPSVEMTIPTGTSNKFGVATHDYGGAAADWELTNSESKCFLLAVSSAGDAANIIAPDAPGATYAISNASGQTVTIKISGGTGVAVNTGKKVLVIHNGTDYTALTAEL